ncbi:MAG: hypothetical protein ACC628_26435 [Pirellulaceae bacterium]
MQPRAVRAHLISASEFRVAGDRLFVSPSLGFSEEAEFANRHQRAKARVEHLFGGYSNDATIIVAADATSSMRYSPNEHATIHTSPFGAYVVLGPEGFVSVDVIAHELAHAEHFRRVGYFRWLATPAWFREGLAMQVDQRSEYSSAWLDRAAASGKAIPSVIELSTYAEFSRGDLTVNYAAARREVAQILSRLGPRGASRFLESQRLIPNFLGQLEWAMEGVPAAQQDDEDRREIAD